MSYSLTFGIDCDCAFVKLTKILLDVGAGKMCAIEHKWRELAEISRPDGDLIILRERKVILVK